MTVEFLIKDNFILFTWFIVSIVNTVINYSKLNSLEFSRESKRRWCFSFFLFSEHLRIPFSVFFFFAPPDRKDRFAFREIQAASKG